jgi:hypothetical protein
VARFDPDQAIPAPVRDQGAKVVSYKEVPYDYGIGDPVYRAERNQGGNWNQSVKNDYAGIIPTKDQLGPKWFQDGVGVNMRGDVVEQCNIYYAPKMDDEARDFAEAPTADYSGRGKGEGMFRPTYGDFMKQVMEMEKKGEEVYSIKRQPGVQLTGATAWTFNANGELRDACAVTAGGLINGVQIDEDGKLYFVVSRRRLYDRKPFLEGRGGIFGGTKKETPYMGTYIKSAGKDVKVLATKSPYVAIPLDRIPERPPEVDDTEFCWVEGAEWFYAGASPIVSPGHCSCPTMRSYTDWYKRSFVPEAYRHSIGILDTNGNLIVHMGQYGNIDSADGAKSKIPVGGDNIAISFTRFVSATDNYVVFDDNSERVTVAKLNYHAEETAGIG